MDTIALVKDKQQELSKRVKKIKKGIKSKNIVIKENGSKKPKNMVRRPFRKPNATIYLGHIPHGFYENEIMSYFGQFGKVLSARVARSKKTGRSRGFGFVEFQNEEVAQIAAETMNNYLMFNRLLTCRYIPPEERKAKYNIIDPKNCPKKTNRLQDLQKKNSSIKRLNSTTYQAKVQKKIKEFKNFFEENGIDFSLKVNETLGKTDSKPLMKKPSKKSANESDDQLGVLEIDESDNEIHFTTPPHVKKVIRKSFDSSIINKTNKVLKTPIIHKEKLKKLKTMVKTNPAESSAALKHSKTNKNIMKTKETLSKALKKKNLNRPERVKPQPKTVKSLPSMHSGSEKLTTSSIKEKAKRVAGIVTKKTSTMTEDSKLKKTRQKKDLQRPKAPKVHKL